MFVQDNGCSIRPAVTPARTLVPQLADEQVLLFHLLLEDKRLLKVGLNRLELALGVVGSRALLGKRFRRRLQLRLQVAERLAQLAILRCAKISVDASGAYAPAWNSSRTTCKLRALCASASRSDLSASRSADSAARSRSSVC